MNKSNWGNSDDWHKSMVWPHNIKIQYSIHTVYYFCLIISPCHATQIMLGSLKKQTLKSTWLENSNTYISYWQSHAFDGIYIIDLNTIYVFSCQNSLKYSKWTTSIHLNWGHQWRQGDIMAIHKSRENYFRNKVKCEMFLQSSSDENNANNFPSETKQVH